jgi:hypothetical protein
MFNVYAFDKRNKSIEVKDAIMSQSGASTDKVKGK